MGLQYRVDNWAKHKKAPDENSFKKFDPDTLNRTSYRPGRKPGKSSAWLLCIVYPLIAATPFCFAGDDVPKQKEAGKAIAQSNSPETQKSQEVTSPAIIIKADRQGHFRGLALINNVSMPFLIDTGATKNFNSIQYGSYRQLRLRTVDSVSYCGRTHNRLSNPDKKPKNWEYRNKKS